MGDDRLDFSLAQPEKPSATSGRIVQWFHTACGVEKKKKERKGQKSINSWNFWTVYG